VWPDVTDVRPTRTGPRHSQGRETPARRAATIEEDRDVMRDIGNRIQRYRLSRYATPVDRVRRNLRWAWLAGALWLAWVGFLSEHNLLRLRQLSNEGRHSEAQLRQLNHEVARLDAERADPEAQRLLAEHALREKSGMAKRGEIIYLIRPSDPAKR